MTGTPRRNFDPWHLPIKADQYARPKMPPPDDIEQLRPAPPAEPHNGRPELLPYVWRRGDAEREAAIAAQLAELRARAGIRRELGPLAVLVDDQALNRRLAEAKQPRRRHGKQLFVGDNRHAAAGRYPGQPANPAPAPEPVPGFSDQLITQAHLGVFGFVQLSYPVC